MGICPSGLHVFCGLLTAYDRVLQGVLWGLQMKYGGSQVHILGRKSSMFSVDVGLCLVTGSVMILLLASSVCDCQCRLGQFAGEMRVNTSKSDVIL